MWNYGERRTKNGFLTLGTNNVNDSIEMKSIKNTFTIEDFYFEVLELIKYQEQQLKLR